jgi:diguanylate cyclase (GGDEF)-like protein
MADHKSEHPLQPGRPTRIVLLADDPAEVVRLIDEPGPVFEARLDVTGALGLGAAAEELAGQACDLVLVDLSSRNGRGVDHLRAIREARPDAPIVVVAPDHSVAAECLAAGAHDYLLADQLNPRLLRRIARHVMDRHRIQQELEAAREQERYLATHDPFTGLPNRQLLVDRTAQALRYADRYEQWVGILFLDLDRFKTINDTLGHAAGDELLRAVVERVSLRIRRSDTAARYGGDEFVILLLNITHAEDAGRVARNLIRTISKPFVVGDHSITVTPSIGIAVYPGDGDGAEELISSADMAMYRAKERGGNTYEFFAPTMNKAALDQLDMESDLRAALTGRQIVVHYQPLIDARRWKIVGAEALVRWQHPTRGLIGPDEFIPLAERTGLIVPLGDYIMREACLQHREWSRDGFAPIRMAVNISARQFWEPKLVDSVSRVLSDTGMNPTFLDLEVTESCMVENEDLTVAAMQKLKDLGLGISVDDFGTGYSSFRALKRFPCDNLKVGRVFVRGVPHNPDDVGISHAIIAIAESMGLGVIAEGVERPDQLRFFQNWGCFIMQGHLFSPAVPASEFDALLTRDLAAAASG